MNFLGYKKIYFLFSGILVLGSLVSIFSFGLNLGIEFTGGSILEVEYLEQRPSIQVIQQNLSDLDLGSIYVQSINEKGIIIRMKNIDENLHQQVLKKLKQLGKIEEKRFETIGPVIGRELKEKTKVVIIVSLLAIVFYIALAFRKIQRPIQSWQYGLATLIALFHDLLIPLGILAILGKFYGVQITIPVITALLTVFGYSVNDTVVVFDRIRENLLKRVGVTFEDTINKSLNQIFIRCINTSLSTLLVLSALYFLGGETLKYFSLTLIVGIIAGTYSSLFLASPILAIWQQKFGK